METDRYGKPLKEAKPEEVAEDLKSLPEHMVYALCIQLIVDHETHTWQEIYSNLVKEVKELNS